MEPWVAIWLAECKGKLGLMEQLTHAQKYGVFKLKQTVWQWQQWAGEERFCF